MVDPESWAEAAAVMPAEAPALWFVVDEGEVCPRIVGGSAVRVLGRDGPIPRDALVRLVHPDDRSRVVTERLSAIRDGQPSRIEYRVQIADDAEPRWVLELATCLATGTGHVLQGVVIDMTAEHLAFEWLDRSRNAAEDEVVEISRRDQAKETFIQLLLHDASPALRACLEGVGALERGRTDDSVVSMLRTGISELAGLIEGVLDVQRFRGNADLHVERVDLAEVAEVVTERLSSPRIQLEKRSAVALGDPLLLQRVVDNLVRNALVHTDADTVVRVRTGHRERVYLEVADHGPGIPLELAGEVFEPYIRLSGPDRPGLGMGLALVRRLVELHEGTCSLFETPGGGATFRVELPAYADRKDPASSDHEQVEQGRAEAVSLR